MIYTDIDHFLRHNTDDMVCFCVSSGGCVDLTANLVKSCNIVGVPIVVFALDEEVPNKLKDECEIVLYNSQHEIDSSKFYKITSTEFKHVIFQRFLIGNTLLEHGKTIVYLDVDIVVKNDFRNNIFSLLEKPETDALFQQNHLGRACTGFYSFKPTKNTVGLFTQDFLDENEYLTYDKNQPFLYEKVLPKSLFEFKYLNRDEYPNGHRYYRSSGRIDNICYLIHFNCTRGESSKIKMMKKYGYWSIDK